jgi:hypothetical protein
MLEPERITYVEWCKGRGRPERNFHWKPADHASALRPPRQSGRGVTGGEGAGPPRPRDDFMLHNFLAIFEFTLYTVKLYAAQKMVMYRSRRPSHVAAPSVIGRQLRRRTIARLRAGPAPAHQRGTGNLHRRKPMTTNG